MTTSTTDSNLNFVPKALELVTIDDYAMIKLTLEQLALLGYIEVNLNDDLSNLNEVGDYLEDVLDGHSSAKSDSKPD
jgi:type IV secretory pathway ATPase VirB11/archaellum biosynthesis ATPase